MTDQELKSKLAAYTREKLNIVAKKLTIKKYRRGTKQELVERVLAEATRSQITKAMSVSPWDRIRHHLFGWSSVIGLILTMLSVFGYLSQKQNPGNQVADTAPTSSVSALTSPSPTPNASPSETPLVSATLPAQRPAHQVASYISHAEALYNAGKYQEAISWCDKALRIDPQNQRASILKSRIERTTTILRSDR